MGNPRAALKLIIKKLQDVDKVHIYTIQIDIEWLLKCVSYVASSLMMNFTIFFFLIIGRGRYGTLDCVLKVLN